MRPHAAGGASAAAMQRKEASVRTEVVRVDWLGEREFRLADRAGYAIRMSQPEGVNGADLLPLSLIGCAAWDVLGILVKQRQAVTRFAVEAASERDEAIPWRFRRIRITYRIEGRRLDESAVRRAIGLTEGKYCSVYATLKDAVELVSDFELSETGG